MPVCRHFWLVAVLVCLFPCQDAAAQLRRRSAPRPCPSRVVFVADGAGNFQVASRILRSVVRADGLPIDVVTFEWSHGYGRILADQVSLGYSREKGQELAGAVLHYRDEHPDVPVYLVGHSAGSMVIVTALESLPPGSVERAVLLSPSLSTYYDLRPALESVSGGLHVFHSQPDWWYLGVYTRLIGTADRRHAPAGGRVGFQVSDDDFELDRLYQRPWQPEDRKLGNQGGHYGNYQPGFLRAHVVPLLLADPAGS